MFRLVYTYRDGFVDLEGTYGFRTTARNSARQSLACFTRAMRLGAINDDNMPTITIVDTATGETVETVS